MSRGAYTACARCSVLLLLATELLREAPFRLRNSRRAPSFAPMGVIVPGGTQPIFPTLCCSHIALASESLGAVPPARKPRKGVRVPHPPCA